MLGALRQRVDSEEPMRTLSLILFATACAACVREREASVPSTPPVTTSADVIAAPGWMAIETRDAGARAPRERLVRVRPVIVERDAGMEGVENAEAARDGSLAADRDSGAVADRDSGVVDDDGTYITIEITSEDRDAGSISPAASTITRYRDAAVNTVERDGG
jgi:hypothetical protein